MAEWGADRDDYLVQSNRRGCANEPHRRAQGVTRGGAPAVCESRRWNPVVARLLRRTSGCERAVVESEDGMDREHCDRVR